MMTIISSLVVVLKKNVLHSALALVGALSGVSALYALMGADFLFAVQILVYVGGVTVLILFVILLSGRPSEWMGRAFNAQWLVALFVVLLIVWGFTMMAFLLPEGSPLTETVPSTASLGSLLLGPMILPFEVVSLVLLVALIGAVYFTSDRFQKEK